MSLDFWYTFTMTITRTLRISPFIDVDRLISENVCEIIKGSQDAARRDRPNKNVQIIAANASFVSVQRGKVTVLVIITLRVAPQTSASESEWDQIRDMAREEEAIEQGKPLWPGGPN